MDPYERVLRDAGYSCIAGADEAGRGACAGPLVAAAVILGDEVPAGLDDSKRLTPACRDALFNTILATARAVAIASAGPAECDAGIQRANLRALRDAVVGLSPAPGFAIVDGFAVPGLPCPSIGMWKGDQLVAAVSAASIIAKVTRDRVMVALDERYPGYGFAVHKGYVTRLHQRALVELGPCPEHRRSFRNVSSLCDVTG